MSLPRLSESIIQVGATAQSFERGQAYYQGGAIYNTAVQGSALPVIVRAISRPPQAPDVVVRVHTAPSEEAQVNFGPEGPLFDLRGGASW